jgi:hypothetical protein
MFINEILDITEMFDDDLSLAKLKNVDAEGIRKEFFDYESSLKTVAILFYIGALSLCFIGIANTLNIFGWGKTGYIIAVICYVLTVINIWIGNGLCNLNLRVRIPCLIFAIIGFLFPPFGTYINAKILKILFSAKAKVVFSASYKEIIALTPNIKYKLPAIPWFLIGFILIVVCVILFLCYLYL